MMIILDKLLSFIDGLSIFKLQHIYFVFTALFSVILIEIIFLGWNSSSLKKLISFDQSSRIDLFFLLLSMFNLYALFSIFLTLGICYFTVGLIQNYFHFHLILHFENVYLQYFILLLLSDFVKYLRHLFYHKIKFFWIAHSFHHSATDLIIFTRSRGHFIESELNRFTTVFLFVIFGAPIHAYFIVQFLLEVHQYILHSQIKSDWGILGKYIFVSPQAHRTHHSVDNKHFNKNFGDTFIIWDRIFGTYYETNEELKFGIPNNEFNKKGIWFDIYLVFKKGINYFGVKIKH